MTFLVSEKGVCRPNTSIYNQQIQLAELQKTLKDTPKNQETIQFVGEASPPIQTPNFYTSRKQLNSDLVSRFL